MTALGEAVGAFASALRVQRMDRPAFDRWQAKRLSRWLSSDLPKVGFYQNAPAQLAGLPVIDKQIVMSRFQDFNLGRITTDQGWAAMAADGQVGGVSIGASTGTSGNRALYAVTPAERYRWLGAMLAKTVPGFLFRAERVAVILPQSSALYDGANRAGPMVLKFFDLRDGPETWTKALIRFAPTTIIAPPRVLRHLAETAPSLAPRRLYAGAETLDPMDQEVIEHRFGQRLGQIYMATEGLLGVTCAHGRLHLAEDATYFEFEPVGDGLVSPLITGFRRSFQIMARYRMNDLLRLSPQRCACGSPLQVVDEVVGRMDDVFAFGEVIVTPDILRNAVLDAARSIDDFRILRDGAMHVSLVLKPDLPAHDADAAKTALCAIFERRKLPVLVTVQRDPLTLNCTRKLRRVENRWKDAP